MLRAVFFVDVPHRLAGAQRSLLAAVRRIREHGVEPRVIFPGDGICAEAYRAAGVPTEVLAAPPAVVTFGRRLLATGWRERAAIAAQQVLPYARRLAGRFAELDADVVHFNTPRGIVFGGVAARAARRPTVLHLRGVPAIGAGVWTAAELLADRIVLVARALEPHVHAFRRDRCRVVYNGVDPPAVPPRDEARRALAELAGVGEGALAGRAVFVSLSSPTPFKGLHHLVAAAARARAQGVDALYVLAGTAPDEAYQAWLRRRIEALGLGDAVRLVGYVDRPLALVAAADALVLPSVEREDLVLDDGTRIDVRGTEGLPRSILESLSLGTAVVATRVAGVEEQVEHGVTGLVVPPGDPDALADALVRVAGDDALRARARREGPAVVAQRFTTAAAARGLADVLHEVAPARVRRAAGAAGGH